MRTPFSTAHGIDDKELAKSTHLKTAKDIIKSFFAEYGEEGSFGYKEGWEAIPENWYRTPVDYSLVPLNLDLIDWIIGS